MAFDAATSGSASDNASARVAAPVGTARAADWSLCPPRRLALSYVLPLRGRDDTDLTELTQYLRWLAERVDVVVVDDSPAELFARHQLLWRGLVRHLAPDPAIHGLNRKVVGVLTGVPLARHEHVVIADDDVRYDGAGLRAVHRLLDSADLVRPQNYFDPLPWHAWWDTGRTLLNRALGGDYPGTLAVRRSTFLAMRGYDPDVLFENLELIRTVRAYGGVEVAPAGLYVRRLPPSAAHFRGQRIRQAYDDLAQPARLVAALAVLPALAVAVASRRPGLLIGAAATIVALAEAGRRRAGGRRVYPPSTALAAPAWLLERGVCGWLALGARLRGGARYAGTRIPRAAHPVRTLRP
ncbi:Glycosyltransferase like family 2 [Micromonospora nigra]|uniref:Glycosyltransferase like family 2 n=1 Tax=Micromonospora nigra TaxID=145857 RepID=A0A1C6RKF5_9ACTN|nr:glycosyltransferase family 2 protein [Micromonospora nigra]SCL17552.1 Glycosyltransferase like family 2 [Micromonospora nigra]